MWLFKIHRFTSKSQEKYNLVDSTLLITKIFLIICLYVLFHITFTKESCIFNSSSTPFLNSEIDNFASSSSAHSSASSYLKITTKQRIYNTSTGWEKQIFLLILMYILIYALETETHPNKSTKWIMPHKSSV